MKRIIFAFSFLLLAVSLNAQLPPNYEPQTKRIQVIGIKADDVMTVPRFCGTPLFPAKAWVAEGAIGQDTCNHRFYIYMNGSWTRMSKYSDIPAFGDTLSWKTGGNNASLMASDPWFGTIGATDILIRTNNTLRANIPATGIVRNNADSVRCLAYDTISKKLYYKDCGNGTFYNSNVGSASRLAIPGTNNLKTIDGPYSVKLDSATANQLAVKLENDTTASPALYHYGRNSAGRRGWYSNSSIVAAPQTLQTVTTAGNTTTTNIEMAGGILDNYNSNYIVRLYNQGISLMRIAAADGSVAAQGYGLYYAPAGIGGTIYPMGAYSSHITTAGGGDAHTVLQDQENSILAGFVIAPNRLLTVEKLGLPYCSWYNNPANNNAQVLIGFAAERNFTNYQNYRFVAGELTAFQGRVFARDTFGLNTETPAARFHVVGTTRFDLGSDATGDIFYRNSSGFFTRLPVGSNGQILTLASGLPSWATNAASGTVGTGSQYRIAYYATTGTAISEAAAITASRVLVSDANGVPTHSTVTTTELGYVSGATSSLQTQITARLIAASNLSDLANAGTARTNLGLAIGTNVQAYDADLDYLATFTPTANVKSVLNAADYAAIRTLLGLTIGTNVQAYDADLTTYAGITPSANVQTLLAAASFAAFKASLSLDNVDNTSDATKNAAAVTLTNKRIIKRTGTTASSGTPTINTDNIDVYTITALAANITSFTTNLSGTPNLGEELVIYVKDNGTSRTLAFGASFEDGAVTLPTATTISTTLAMKFYRNIGNTAWMIMSKSY